MRAVLSNFSFSAPFSFIGLSVTVKIITAVVAVIVAAGGVVYTLSQKSYAAKTINFDGQELFLVSEKLDGEVIKQYSSNPSGAHYIAGYFDSADVSSSSTKRIFTYWVFYNASPEVRFIQDGVFSAKAYMREDWQEGFVNDSRAYLYQVRESSGDGITELFVHDPYENGKDLFLRGRFCGASQKNAIACIHYWVRERNDQYATAKEWAEKEGAAHLERMYELLTAYPLAHNEELLADMKLAVEGQL